jgi:8-oxo-dGTP pyrophosphatase MutT (NUDIX family)
MISVSGTPSDDTQEPLVILDDDALREHLLALPEAWEGPVELRSAAVLHPGQISFPGGQRDNQESPLECALRECQEEIGQEPSQVLILGALGARRSSSDFHVQPVIGRIPNPIDLRPDPREVTSILSIPLRELLEESRWENREHTTPERSYRETPHFDHGDHTIWGLTGRFTTELLAAIRVSLETPHHD